MSRQTWTAALSALLFVILATIIALVPVPYVTWSPGSTYNLLGEVNGKPAISISGAQTYPSSGELLMATIEVTAPDSSLTLPEALISYWMPARQVLPRAAIYRRGTTPSEVDSEESTLMTNSQTSAVVAALRAAEIPVTELPMVQSVQTSGAAAGLLEPGDLISAVDNVAVTDRDSVLREIQNRHVGQKVTFTITRNQQTQQVTVTTRANLKAPDYPSVGIEITTGYTYSPLVTYAVDPAVGGSSGGLMFALTIYDKLTPGDLTQGRTIAGTGTMSADGKVGVIGGVAEKLAAASKAGATVFLIPKDNCQNVTSVPAGLRLVAVDNLDGAIGDINALNDPSTAAGVPGC
ncbi:MAG: PDZ domain-containing protein [Propionicimonas sp.]